MKKLFFYVLVFCATTSIAQPVQLHLLGGFSNYNGDLQQKPFTLNQARGAIGVGATYEITDHLSLRGDYIYAHVGADDKQNVKATLISRNLNFQTPIHELSLLGEYDIFSLYQHQLTPYVFGGIALFHFNPYTFDATGNKVFLAGLSTEGEGFIKGRKVYNRTDFSVPVGGGLKYALSNDIRIGFEYGLRVLKTDYLDDVSTTYIDQNTLLAARGQTAVDFAYRGDETKLNPRPYPAGGSQRGNSKINDFYYFGLLRVDFRLNWFDIDGTGRGRGKGGLGCPVRL